MPSHRPVRHRPSLGGPGIQMGRHPPQPLRAPRAPSRAAGTLQLRDRTTGPLTPRRCNQTPAWESYLSKQQTEFQREGPMSIWQTPNRSLSFS